MKHQGADKKEPWTLKEAEALVEKNRPAKTDSERTFNRRLAKFLYLTSRWPFFGALVWWIESLLLKAISSVVYFLIRPASLIAAPIVVLFRRLACVDRNRGRRWGM